MAKNAIVKCSFVREVRQEASKVTWPTRKETDDFDRHGAW